MLKFVIVAMLGVTATFGYMVIQSRQKPSDPFANASFVSAPANSVFDLPLAKKPAVDMQALSRGVLVNLGAEPETPAVTQTAQITQGEQPSDDFRPLTSSVLSGLNTPVAEQPETPSAPVDLQTLIVRALSDGRSSAYIDQLVNEAAYNGTVQIPTGLATAEGRVDTTTLLKVLVNKADAQNESAYVATLNAAATAQNAKSASTPETYVVQPGDSLAAIPFRFYGNTADYIKIFQANADNLSSPNRIKIGQKLIIPAA